MKANAGRAGRASLVRFVRVAGRSMVRDGQAYVLDYEDYH